MKRPEWEVPSPFPMSILARLDGVVVVEAMRVRAR